VLSGSKLDETFSFTLLDSDGFLALLQVGGWYGFSDVGINQALTLFL